MAFLDQFTFAILIIMVYHMYAYEIVKDKESIPVIQDEKEAFKILRNV